MPCMQRLFFPLQDREWSLPAGVPLTPLAAERLAREAAEHPFDHGARALSIDWNSVLPGKQVERWAQRLGPGAPESAAAGGHGVWPGDLP